jgi:hypothetical protein
MEKDIINKNGVTIALLKSNTPIIIDVQSALDILATIDYFDNCQCLAIYKKVIIEDFFNLRTGLTGDILQNFQTTQKS